MDLALRKRPPMHSIPGPCPPCWDRFYRFTEIRVLGSVFLFLFSFLSRYLKARVLCSDGPCAILLSHLGVLSALRGTGLLSPMG